MDVIFHSLTKGSQKSQSKPITYPNLVEEFINDVKNDIEEKLPQNKKYLSRWLALKLLDENSYINEALKPNCDLNLKNFPVLTEKLVNFKEKLKEQNLTISSLQEKIVSSIVTKAEEIGKEVCIFTESKYKQRTRKIDKILTSKKYGFPIMLIFLALIFWITITRCQLSISNVNGFFYIYSRKASYPCAIFYNKYFNLWNVSNSILGRIRNASSNGDILSTIYFA